MPTFTALDADRAKRVRSRTRRPEYRADGAARGGDLGFEAKLWQAADLLRGNLDAAEYKHVVLGLIFLKYISDAFTERREHLLRETADPTSEYYVRDPAVRYEVAEDRDEYLAENVFWVPPEARWARLQGEAKQPTIGRTLDEAMAAIERENPRLRGVLPKDYGREQLDKRRLGELIDLIGTIGLGDAANRSRDILGRVYEYFLGQFASAEGKKGGELLRQDVRWAFGAPPVGNANFAWVQHIVHHLAPNGTAGFVLANGSMSSNTGGEGEIRRKLVEADLVDCMVALPGQLFYSTQIPVCLWFLARDKRNSRFRDRHGATLFVDARKLGHLIDRTHRELSDAEIARIARTYHAWRGEPEAGEYADVPGFCKSATAAEIAAHSHVLTPGRYIGAEETEDDGEPFEQKMQRLVAELEGQFAESARLETAIRDNLRGLGFVQ